MKVLLITSEHLYPQNIHSSTFELSQAVALRDIGAQVAVISIYTVSTKSLLFSIFFKFRRKSYVNVNASRFSIFELYRYYFLSIIKKRKVIIKKHSIMGIDVYEGIAFKSDKLNETEDMLNFWIESGYFAFKEYSNSHGIPDIIHAHSRFLTAACLADKIWENIHVPFIITEHSSRILNNSVNENIKRIMVKCYSNSKIVLAVSNAVKNKLIEYGISNVSVLPNMLDDLYSLPIPIKTEKSIFTLITIGNLDKNKNQILLVKAAALLKDIPFRIKIIGHGPEKNTLGNLIYEMNLTNSVVLLGHVSKEKVREEMIKADCLVISSKIETFSVVAIEALACGIPVISTKCGGPEDIVNNNNGILIEQNNPEALANAITCVFRRKDFNPIKIRNSALETYSSQIISKALMTKYKAAVN